LKDFTDTQKQIGIDALAAENVVNVSSFETELVGEPLRFTALAVEFGFNQSANVYGGVTHKKDVKLFAKIAHILR